jgi:hypothetical protein
MRVRRGVAAIAAVMLGGAWGAPPAGAAIVERFSDTYEDSFVTSCDLGTGDPLDDVVVEAAVQGSFSGKLRTRQPDGAVYGTSAGEERVVLTNTETGRSWMTEFRWRDGDLRLLGVEGDVYTYLVGATFHFVVYAPDGRVDSRDDGRLEFVVAYDAATDEGDFVEGRKLVGRFGVGDLCEDAVRFTTG